MTDTGGPGRTASPTVGVVIPAAGLGKRMGGVKKLFLALGGVPVLLLSVRAFLDRSDISVVVVALAPDDMDDPPEWLRDVDPRVRLVTGGATRTDSVRAGLAALPAQVTIVVVHDGARPLVTGGIIDRCIAKALQGRGAVAGWPAVDTMKEVDHEGRVLGTPDRSRLWHAQTPQAFPRHMIATAYASADLVTEATDDATLVERVGGAIVMVEGHPWNIKVTRPQDVGIAELILNMRSS